jgi:predicted nucleic acid-binding protein
LRFWDSSAVLSLLIQEPLSWKTRRFYDENPHLLLWWVTSVECVGALARIDREGRVWKPAVDRAWHLLEHVREDAHEIQPAEEIRLTAQALLLKHPLRAADALQLAAALFWYDDNPQGASFITLDHRLRTAATLEGFEALPYMDEIHEAPAEWETGWQGQLSRTRLPGI